MLKVPLNLSARKCGMLPINDGKTVTWRSIFSDVTIKVIIEEY